MTTQILLPGFEPPPLRNKSLFFAILLNKETAGPVSKLAKQLRSTHRLGGNVLRAESFHISLSHIDDYADVPDSIIELAREAAGLVKAPAFELVLDRALSFPRGRQDKPFVLSSSNTSAALAAFQKELFNSMKGAGLKPSLQKNFIPHLTVLYDEKSITEHEIPVVRWTVREFALVLSHQSESRYEILGSWRLPEPAA
jgi:RNA 2',3'-cyclic 3'-phosphodiesterase